MDLEEIINKIYQIPQNSRETILANVTEVSLQKGHLLLQAGKVETNIYFIKSGLVRAYADTEDRQVTFWFGKEGDAVLSMKSYVAAQRGYENIELLENCALYKLESACLRDLFNTDINLANLGRTLVERELLRTEERLISMQFKTASQRYADLIDSHAGLLQRVQLGHIASYLGITQVSLSRIRSEIR